MDMCNNMNLDFSCSPFSLLVYKLFPFLDFRLFFSIRQTISYYYLISRFLTIHLHGNYVTCKLLTFIVCFILIVMNFIDFYSCVMFEMKSINIYNDKGNCD